MAGTVTAAPAARWSQSREGTVERVQLDDGTIAVHVRPQRPDERFIVFTPDGEIEVRGTTFDVTVEGGRTTGVHVREGVVELRAVDAPVRRLGAGDAWPAAASGALRPAVPAAPGAAREGLGPTFEAGAPPVGRAGADDAIAEYMEATRLLSAGSNDEAAAALRAFDVAHPTAPQAEDVTFLEAVALARAGRVDAAGLAAEHHLARFPASFHAKEAAVLVVRAARLRDAGP
jgi:hypothetical protein